jgi:TRAP transporter 4TM/12TM fusion protein
MSEETIVLDERRKLPWWLLTVGFGFGVLFLGLAFFPMADQWKIGIFTWFCWALSFAVLDPLGTAKLRDPVKVPLYDWLAIAGATVCCFYYIYYYEDLIASIGDLKTTDRIVVVVALLLALEASRRAIGIWVAASGIGMLAYCLYLGFTWDQILTRVYLGESGMFGEIADIFARYILLFLIFGSIMERAGAIKLLGAFVHRFAERTPGGAAKAAVVGSAVMGGVVGSSSANVAVTGVVTIPMMIKQGYSRHRAGAIEASAGLGGEITPPIMGSAAFILAANTGIPYREIMLIAILPALLYYISLFASIHFEAQRKSKHLGAMRAAARSETEKPWNYVHLIIPPVVVVSVVLSGYSPTYGAGAGILSALLVSQFSRHSRLSPADMFDAIARGAISFLPLGATAAMLGVIMVGTVLSGLSTDFASWTTNLGQGSLPLVIIAVFLLGLILGLGLPIVASYMILATACGPGLQSFGLPIIAAHLLMLWYVQTAAISPPSALAAQIAANIAGANFYKTCLSSVWMCMPFYIVPLWFVYTPLVTGDLPTRIGYFIVVAAGLVMMGVASNRWLRGSLNWAETAAAGVAAFLLLTPWQPFNWAGGALAIITVLWRFVGSKEQTASVSA